MQPSTCNQLACSKCQFFQPDGRYHGSCDKMNVTVKGEWKACHLALPAFNSFDQPILLARSKLSQVIPVRSHLPKSKVNKSNIESDRY